MSNSISLPLHNTNFLQSPTTSTPSTPVCQNSQTVTQEDNVKNMLPRGAEAENNLSLPQPQKSRAVKISDNNYTTRRQLHIANNLIYNILEKKIFLADNIYSGINKIATEHFDEIKNFSTKVDSYYYKLLEDDSLLNKEDRYELARSEKNLAFLKLIFDWRCYYLAYDGDEYIHQENKSILNYVINFCNKSDKVRNLRKDINTNDIIEKDKQYEVYEVLFAVDYLQNIISKAIKSRDEIANNALIKEGILNDKNKEILGKILDFSVKNCMFDFNGNTTVKNTVLQKLIFAIGYYIIGKHEQTLNILTDLNKKLYSNFNKILSEIKIIQKDQDFIDDSITLFNGISDYLAKNITDLNYLNDHSPNNIQSYVNNVRNICNEYNKITKQIWSTTRIGVSKYSFYVKLGALSTLFAMDISKAKDCLFQYDICIQKCKTQKFRCLDKTNKTKEICNMIEQLVIPEEFKNTGSFCEATLFTETIKYEKLSEKNNQVNKIIDLLYKDVHWLKSFIHFINDDESGDIRKNFFINNNKLYYTTAVVSRALSRLEESNKNVSDQNQQQIIENDESNSLLVTAKKEQPITTEYKQKVTSTTEVFEESDSEDDTNQINVIINQNSPLSIYKSILDFFYENPKKNLNKAIADFIYMSNSDCKESQKLAFYALSDILNTTARLKMDEVISTIKNDFFIEAEKYLLDKRPLPRDLYYKFKQYTQRLISTTDIIENYNKDANGYINKLSDIYIIKKNYTSESEITPDHIKGLYKEVHANTVIANELDCIIQKMQYIIALKKSLNSFFYQEQLLTPKTTSISSDNTKHENPNRQNLMPDFKSISDFSSRSISIEDSFHDNIRSLEKILNSRDSQ